LPMPGVFPIMIGRGKDMEHCFSRFTHRFAGAGAVLVAAFSLLFPGSGSVLCIAPGTHIAIEAINAECCESPRISVPAAHPSNNPLDMTGNCENCVDLFLAFYGREGILQSDFSPAGGMQVCATVGNHRPEDPSLPISRKSDGNSAEAPVITCPAVPLLC
jgi:hypothetical protein